MAHGRIDGTELSVRRLVLSLLAVGLLAGAFLVGAVPCSVSAAHPRCVVALEPGPTRDTLGIVEIAETRTYASAGELLLTTVAVDADLDLWEWLQTFALRDVDRVPREALLPGGIDEEELLRQTAAQMGRSQTIAAAAGLRAAGYDVTLTARGAEISDLIAGMPAEEVLEVGDVIVAVDRRPVRDASDASGIIRGRQPGTTVELTVRRGGQELTVPVELAEVPPHGQDGADGDGGDDDAPHGVVGAYLTDHLPLPVDVRIDAGPIGGPSAGLMFALSVVELLAAEDLTGGAVIAGTGSIEQDGAVGAIGGVRQKLHAAASRRDRAADVFLVPAGNAEEARAAAVDRQMLVVPVATLEDAVTALRAVRDGRTPDGAFALGR